MDEIKQLEARVKALEAKVFPADPPRESPAEVVERLRDELNKKRAARVRRLERARGKK